MTLLIRLCGNTINCLRQMLNNCKIFHKLMFTSLIPSAWLNRNLLMNPEKHYKWRYFFIIIFVFPSVTIPQYSLFSFYLLLYCIKAIQTNNGYMEHISWSWFKKKKKGLKWNNTLTPPCSGHKLKDGTKGWAQWRHFQRSFEESSASGSLLPMEGMLLNFPWHVNSLEEEQE